MSRSRNIQSMIGYGLPYVFVEKIKLTDSVFRREDRSYFFDNHPSYVRDKYGQNKKQSKTSLDNKEFVDKAPEEVVSREIKKWNDSWERFDMIDKSLKYLEEKNG